MADRHTRSCQASRSDSEKGAWTGRELIGPMEEPELRITSLSRTRAPSFGFRSHSWKERLPAYRLPCLGSSGSYCAVVILPNTSRQKLFSSG